MRYINLLSLEHMIISLHQSLLIREVFVGIDIFFLILFSLQLLYNEVTLMSVTAFQTLEDRENPDEIEANGPYKCRSANAWLGIGYYFWDSNIKWAHEWGEKSYSNDYIICEAKVNIDENCFDLVGNISHQMELIEIIGEFKKSGYLSDKGTVYLGQLIQLMKNQDVFGYKSIRANDNKKAYNLMFTKNNRETTTLLKRTQICLVDKTNLVLRTFRIIYPGHYTEG